ncbi:MAG: DEAD/DEAH box helicase [Spirochaetota bacterium]
MSFTSFNLHPEIKKGIAKAAYTNPTPIQEQSIPIILQGKDIIGLAQTGTGKTAAFALPILSLLANSKKRGILQALIIAPTRELALQIHETFETLASFTQLKSAAIFGGVNSNPQVRKLQAGIDIAVVCPGRFLDHIKQGNVRLQHLAILVLDEADQMFDMGFFPTIRQILRKLPDNRQNLLFSATMPKEIMNIAKEVLHNPTTIKISNSTPPTTVSHALYPVSPHLKTSLLLKLLDRSNTGSVLIFTRTKYRAKKLGEKLCKQGFAATSLQGNLSQSRRQDAMQGFRTGKYQILVATDIAARGIDVNNVSNVINYDIPSTPEAYIHRIGRTGRAAKTGDASTFVSAEDKQMVRAIERALNTTIIRKHVDDFAYDVPPPKYNKEFSRPPLNAKPSKSSANRTRKIRKKRTNPVNGSNDTKTSIGKSHKFSKKGVSQQK